MSRVAYRAMVTLAVVATVWWGAAYAMWVAARGLVWEERA